MQNAQAADISIALHEQLEACGFAPLEACDYAAQMSKDEWFIFEVNLAQNVTTYN